MSNFPKNSYLIPEGYDEFGRTPNMYGDEPGFINYPQDEFDKDLSEEELDESVIFDFVSKLPSPYKPMLYPDFTAPMDNSYNSPIIQLTSPLFTYPMNVADTQYHYRTLNAKVGYGFQDIQDLLVNAIWSDQKVKIWYTAETDDFVEVIRNVSPLNIRLTKKGKYLVTSLNAFREVRTYRIDRINKIQELFLPAFQHYKYQNYYKWLNPNHQKELDREREPLYQKPAGPVIDQNDTEPKVLDGPPDEEPLFDSEASFIDRYRRVVAREKEIEPSEQLMVFEEPVNTMIFTIFQAQENLGRDEREEVLGELKEAIDQLEGLLVPFSDYSINHPKNDGIDATIKRIKDRTQQASKSLGVSQLDGLLVQVESIENILPEYVKKFS